MYYVLSYWIISTNIGHLDIYGYLQDETAMKKVSDGFTKRYNGIFIGTIGAIYGWLVCIIRPSFWRDGINHITAFYSRKGFCTLNVQYIVDDKNEYFGCPIVIKVGHMILVVFVQQNISIFENFGSKTV